MQIELDLKEIMVLDKVMTKSLKASRKNLTQTKCENQMGTIRASIDVKEKIIKKLRDKLKNAVTE